MASLLDQTTNRRALLVGAAVAVTGALGVAGAVAKFTGGGGASPTATAAATVASTALAAAPSATETATATAGAPSVASSGVRAVQATGPIPAGMALVTSPRLPLFGVGAHQVGDLLGGQTGSWLDVGSPIDLPVEPLTLGGQANGVGTPVADFADYEALVAGLAQRPGGVAVIPLDQVDFRVNVLAVDGVDPLRDVPNDADPLIRLAVVGDIVPGRNVGAKMRAYNDYTHPFLKVASELASYDVTIANLEGNLSSRFKPPDDPHTFTFVADPAMIEGMKLAGIDAVSLGNNHSRWNSEADWGDGAFLDTMDALDAAGLPYFGGGRDLASARAPWVTNPKGKTIAIFGIDGVTANEVRRDGGAVVEGSWYGEDGYAGAGDGVPGTNPYFIDQVTSDIADAAGQYDIVIPYFHFGIEYIGLVPEWAVEGARAAIDAGAAAVVTNHPHLIQGMEIYNGKPIVYSVGNFIFDQMFSVETREGMILELAFRGQSVVGLRCKGVEIEDFHQPRLMSAGEQASLMDRFWWSTDRLLARG